MEENTKESPKDLDEILDEIEFLPEAEVENMNFYEACLYLQGLNVLDEIVSGEVEANE